MRASIPGCSPRCFTWADELEFCRNISGFFARNLDDLARRPRTVGSRGLLNRPMTGPPPRTANGGNPALPRRPVSTPGMNRACRISRTLAPCDRTNREYQDGFAASDGRCGALGSGRNQAKVLRLFQQPRFVPFSRGQGLAKRRADSRTPIRSRQVRRIFCRPQAWKAGRGFGAALPARITPFFLSATRFLSIAFHCGLTDCSPTDPKGNRGYRPFPAFSLADASGRPTPTRAGFHPLRTLAAP